MAERNNLGRKRQPAVSSGTDSGGHTLPAQTNHAVLIENGADVTDQLVPAK